MVAETLSPVTEEALASDALPETVAPAASVADEGPWTSIIRPHQGLFDLRLKELWRYRDLILLFIWRDFVSAYKQTILGPAWHIIQPLLTSVVFTVIFGSVARLPTDGLPKFLFYLSGNVLWGYFSACLTTTANTFVANANLYGKVYFHRLVIPVSVVLSKLIGFGIQLGILLAFMVYFALRGAPVHPNGALLLLPLILLTVAGLGLGGGIMVSAMTTRYRDLAQLVSFGVQLLMYATPVVYPLSAVPARFRPFIAWNPLAAALEAFRYALLGAGTLNVGLLLYSSAATLSILALGLLLFNRVERTFMDTV
jgi:lipopolysaccharide transport system permease protein